VLQKNTTRVMDYTAPRLVTRSKHAFRWRGSTDKSDTLFIEARIKLPRGATPPASWAARGSCQSSRAVACVPSALSTWD
jgi:hypothetical protein